MVEHGGCAIKFYRTEMTISLFFVLQELLFFNPFSVSDLGIEMWWMRKKILRK
jgi:hypothetical protein